MTTATPDSDRCRILVVDDDEDIRVALDRLLTSSGHEILCVDDGLQALRELTRGLFDIVLTDIRMPGVDGMDLAAWVKRERPGTDVIVMTAYASIETAAKALQVGAFDYLLKPFESIELVTSAVRRTVEKRRLEAIRQHFAQRVVQAQEEERRRIARELHDATGQSLSALVFRLGRLEDQATEVGGGFPGEIATLTQVTRDALADLQRIIQGLRPPALDDLGFAAAVEKYTAEYSGAHSIKVDLQIDDLAAAGRLPAATETAIFRIVQEALFNVAKHAQATTVSVMLQKRPPGVQLIIEDNGCGFAVDSATGLAADTKGFGLLGIRERVLLLRGSLTIESQQDVGTTLYVKVPL